jgi:hypothetical protein
MAYHRRDKTLTDEDRRLLNLHHPDIKSVLPEHFDQEYPNLIKLFEKYYDFMDSADNPNARISNLYASRDATQVPENLLSNLEDELLLGNAYFGGFKNKREAIKFSNTLYRSKGTKYSLQQFFRGFFGVDPTIEYPKDKMFLVGPKIDYELDSNNDAGRQVRQAASALGPESQKYIVNDELYQELSVLIRSEISIKEWIDVYKIFVHPAGVFIGSELLIVSSNNNPINLTQDEVGLPQEATVTNVEFAGLNMQALSDETLLVQDSGGVLVRQITQQRAGMYSGATLSQFGTGFENLRGSLSPNSPTFDDSDQSGTIRDFVTMSDSSFSDSIGSVPGSLIRKASFDQNTYDTMYDSDSA